jgi:hypothetical protein
MPCRRTWLSTTNATIVITKQHSSLIINRS